jgi:hypothetical protein
VDLNNPRKYIRSSHHCLPTHHTPTVFINFFENIDERKYIVRNLHYIFFNESMKKGCACSNIALLHREPKIKASHSNNFAGAQQMITSFDPMNCNLSFFLLSALRVLASKPTTVLL